MLRLRIVAIVCAICGLLVVAGWTGGQARGGQEVRGLQFTGELLIVYAESPTESGAGLTNARIETIGARHFIAGTSVDPTNRGDWRAGATVWHPIDDVAQLVEFSTVQAYVDAVEKFDEFGEM